MPKYMYIKSAIWYNVNEIKTKGPDLIKKMA